MFSNYFDVLMSKIIFKNKKNIILIHFQIKNTLKNNIITLPNRSLTLWKWFSLHFYTKKKKYSKPNDILTACMIRYNESYNIMIY